MDRDPSAAGLGVVHPAHDLLSDAPAPDVRVVQQTFIDHWLEIIADASVMQLLPPGLKVEVRNASGSSLPSVAELLVRQYLTGPEPLQVALQRFVACCSDGIMLHGASSELSLFGNGMPALDRRFVGREDHLRQIAENLLSSEPRSVVVRGVPGIGKTTLVRKALADSGIDELYNVVWVSCVDARTIDDLEGCLSRASQLLGHLRSPTMGRSRDPRGLIAANDHLARACRPPSKRLLIVLNRIEKLAETYRRTSTLAAFVAWLEEHVAFGQPRLLITMVGECDLGIDSLDIDLGRLARNEAEFLFTSFTWTSRWRDDWGLSSLVDRFAGHPLALKIAARAAPQHGDLGTFVQLLERHRSPEDDELTVALKLLLLDSSLQDPDVRQLLQFVAYWPRNCELEVIRAILDLPDVNAVIILADPASKLGILEFLDEPPDSSALPGQLYRMPAPLKDRLNRIDPIGESEVRRTRNFVFNRVFHDPEWKYWVNNPYAARFVDLDPLFLDAFQSIDSAVGTAALDAALSMPRKWRVDLMRNGAFPHTTYYYHPLRPGTLRQASDCAKRLGYPARQASLELVAAEKEIRDCDWEREEGRRTEYASKLEADLCSIFETLLKRSDGEAKLGRRKCCSMLGCLALWNACDMGGEERSSHLKQARQYLYMEDLELVPDALPDVDAQQLSVRPVHALLDVVSIHLLRFHLHLQFNAPEDAYHSYLAALASLDTALAADPHQCADHYYKFLIRLDVAALFAVRGALDYASKAVDLALPGSPLPSARPPHKRSGWPHIHSATLFHHYLMDHKDTQSWRQFLLADGGVGCYYTADHAMTKPPWGGSWRSHEIQLFIASCAEDALLAFTTSDQTESLYETWLLVVYFIITAPVEEGVLTPRASYCLLDRSTYRDSRPRSEDLAELKRYLPLPRSDDLTSYHHCYAALSALVEADFAGAASAFVALETTYIQDVSTIDDQVWVCWLTALSVFPPEVRLSVFKPFFRALAEDCLKRHHSASALIRGIDAPDDERLDEPVAIASERLRFYIQAFTLVLIWIASCLPETSRAVQ